MGLREPDDAAVWRLDEQRAVVVTTDFFTPVVDDPYAYGAIAAANSLSDIYAMGARPFLALNIAAFPPQLPGDFLAEIIRGGAEKALEAGVVVAGGHTVQDKEPKYGLVVLGFAELDSLLTKRGLHPGDRLVLTKPLGFGVVTTAIKQEKATPEDSCEVIDWMSRLNRTAGELAVALKLKAATDITGFSLIGHSWEMAQASGCGLRLWWEKIPVLESARRYARKGMFPGGAFDNKMYYASHVKLSAALHETEELLLYDPQTSGGLLLAVPPEKLVDLQEQAQALNQPIWEVGEVTTDTHIEIV